MSTLESDKIPENYIALKLKMGPLKNRLLTYFRKSITDIKFAAEILDRYPQRNRSSFALPATISSVLNT